jgi:hypothetical protein
MSPEVFALIVCWSVLLVGASFALVLIAFPAKSTTQQSIERARARIEATRKRRAMKENAPAKRRIARAIRARV